MIKRSLSQIAAMCGGSLQHPDSGQNLIHGVTTDSRKITEGSLFIPLSGERFDGLQFVEEALNRGAAASFWPIERPAPPVSGPLILVDDPLLALQRLASAYLSELSVRVIGVTGSNGKTTTKDMIASVLSTTYRVHKTIGNFNNHIGLPLTILQMEEQTQMAVLEMGMSGRGEIELLSAIAKPEVAVVTNIGEAHLLHLGSRKEIARAKLEILSGLQENGLLIYNGDEPLITEVLEEPDTTRPAKLNFYKFGFEPSNDDYPNGIMLNARGTIFSTPDSDQNSYFIPLLGEHNVANALAAIAVGRYFKVPEESIHNGLKHLEMTGMRTELIEGINGLSMINDAYNSSPTALRAALQLFDQMGGYRRKIAVLGDMLELGPEEASLHKAVGDEFQGKKIDYLFTYGPLAAHIAEGASVHMPEDRVFSFMDKQELIAELYKVITPRDIVLVKGSRGMKLEEVVQSLRNTAI